MASASSVTALLAEVKESTRRISELVGAVKSWSQMDGASLQDVVVTDGLERTPVMLGHSLNGVTVRPSPGPNARAHMSERRQPLPPNGSD